MEYGGGGGGEGRGWGGRAERGWGGGGLEDGRVVGGGGRGWMREEGRNETAAQRRQITCVRRVLLLNELWNAHVLHGTLINRFGGAHKHTSTPVWYELKSIRERFASRSADLNALWRACAYVIRKFTTGAPGGIKSIDTGCAYTLTVKTIL